MVTSDYSEIPTDYLQFTSTKERNVTSSGDSCTSYMTLAWSLFNCLPENRTSPTLSPEINKVADSNGSSKPKKLDISNPLVGIPVRSTTSACIFSMLFPSIPTFAKKNTSYAPFVL